MYSWSDAFCWSFLSRFVTLNAGVFPIPSINPNFSLNPVSLVIPEIVTGWNNYTLPQNSWNPVRLNIFLADVQKSGVLPGVRPGQRISRQEISTCGSFDLEIKTGEFLFFVKQGDKLLFVLLVKF